MSDKVHSIEYMDNKNRGISGGQASDRTLNITWATQRHEIEGLEEKWRVLVNQFPKPLLTPEWNLAAVETFCPPDQARFIVVKQDAELKALAPMSQKSKLFSHLEFVGSSTLMEPGGMIYSDQQVLAILIKTLLDLKQPLLLKGLSLFSPEVQLLEKELHKRRFFTFVKQRRIPLVDIHQSWEEFEKDHLSSSRRSSFRRLQRKAEKKGTLDFDLVAPGPAEVEDYLEEVYRVEAASWKRRTGTAMDVHPTIGKFFRIYSHKAAELGKLRLFFLKVDDQIIAAQITVVDAEKLWIFKIGHDEEWSWCSPGILLMHRVVEYAFKEGLKACEFLGKDEEWLHIWANDFHSLLTYHIYPRSVVGILSILLDRLKVYYREMEIRLKSRLKH